MTNSAIASIGQNLSNLYSLAGKISNPDSQADVGDIVAFKEAATQAEVNVAVLKRLIDTEKQVVDVIA